MPYINPKQTQKRIIVTKAKYCAQTLPSNMFLGDIWHWVQFRVTTSKDRTWHNTRQCWYPAPNSAGNGSEMILESIRVTSSTGGVNHSFRVPCSYWENWTLEESYGLHSRISLKEESMSFIIRERKPRIAPEYTYVASVTPTSHGLTQSATEGEH